MPDATNFKVGAMTGNETIQRDEDASPGGQKFAPSDFMRARRPELYSDSVADPKPHLDRVHLEYYLDTLTQRKEELRFEHFCRRLAEKELCPNLLPQTGPTGGGDSKVDTETYPVADAIKDRWYEGDPRAGQERWAFAFSAKKAWRSKCRDDVEKIVDARRDYSVIYFITNQAVADRDRASLEDDLRTKFGADVRILDRTWILDRVIHNQRWDVVYQTLDIEQPGERRITRPGPLDAQRQGELEDLERQIGDADRYVGLGYQLVDDCVQAALLARGLGKPRVEIDGRFARAERLARNFPDTRLLFRVFYNQAWTAYWWFDDFQELERLYGLAETLVLDADYVWDIDKLMNLWQLSAVWQNNQGNTATSEIWVQRTERLRAALLRHASDAAKPTSALWARTQLVLMDLVQAARKPATLPPIIAQLRHVLLEADGHLDYPADVVGQLVEELADAMGDIEGFDELFETATAMRSKRVGRAEEGRMRLQRGLQKLRAGKPYDAIDQAARAQHLLAQEPHKTEFLRALATTGLAYEAAGLLWAARGNFVVALSNALYEYIKDGRLEPGAIPILRKLVWIEMQLGRAPCVLVWLDWLRLIAGISTLSEEEMSELQEELGILDGVLGILVLRTRFADWPLLSSAPGLLKHESLPMSRLAALFSLGASEQLETESQEDMGAVAEMAARWIDQPAADDLPLTSEWNLGERVSMRTALLGCEVEFVVDNQVSSILLAEALLGYFESFLATTFRGPHKYLMATTPHMQIAVRPTDTALLPFSIAMEEDDCGESLIVISHPKVAAPLMTVNENYGRAILELSITLLAKLQIPTLDESMLRYFFEVERTQDRAFLIAQSVGSVCNILGETPKYHVNDWPSEKLREIITLQRTTSWSAALSSGEGTSSYGEKPLRFSPAPPSRELFGVDGLKHRNLRVYSPINMELWDRAGWSGTAFITDPRNLPELILAFRKLEAAEKIFRGWRKRVGPVDQDEWIGVTVITGVNKDFPAHYRVAISVGTEHIVRDQRENGPMLLVSRMTDMRPNDATNLNRFRAMYERTGSYRLGMAELSGSLRFSTDHENLSIVKKRIRFVEAWQVGPEDPVSMSMGGICQPVIPANATDAPFSRLAIAQSDGRPGPTSES